MSKKTKKYLQPAETVLLVSGVTAVAFSALAFVYSVLFQLRAEKEFTNLANSSATCRKLDERQDEAASPMGRLEIPAVGLKVIVFEGTDPWTLNRALGHIPGTAFPGEPGNMGIAGHRDTFFRSLRNVGLNDQFILRTPANTYYYRVESINIVAPEDTAVLRSSRNANLTLVTCYPFYFVGSAPQRFIVKAHQVNVPPGF